MKVLVACEESQRVCTAFRERGHEAYSCDIIEPSGGHPEWHILGDALDAIRGGYYPNHGRSGSRRGPVGSSDRASALHIPHQRGSGPHEGEGEDRTGEVFKDA